LNGPMARPTVAGVASFVRLVERGRKPTAPTRTRSVYFRHGLDCCTAVYPSRLSEDDAVRVLIRAVSDRDTRATLETLRGSIWI
jgi:hypothetical protein